MEMQKNFWQILFDNSFKDFITTRILKVFYVIGIIVFIIYMFIGIFVLTYFDLPKEIIIVAIILCPVVFFLFVIFLRILYEGSIVIFRISENLEYIADQIKKDSKDEPKRSTFYKI